MVSSKPRTEVLFPHNHQPTGLYLPISFCTERINPHFVLSCSLTILFTEPRGHAHRPVMPPALSNSLWWQQNWGLSLAPLTLWICVSASIRYGYFSDRRVFLGPNSSVLIKASSVFVEQVEIRDDEKKEVLLYGFSEKPELSFEKDWSMSDNVHVAPYGRKGFYFWLNKDSRIHLSWHCQTSFLNQLQVVLIRGEKEYEIVLPTSTIFIDALNHSAPLSGNFFNVSSEETVLSSANTGRNNPSLSGKEAQYVIGKDDKYWLGLVNTHHSSILVKIAINVTSKLYDLSKAKNVCSTIKRSCPLMLLFPQIRYVLVNTPDSGDLRGSYIEISFVARLITYIAILGLMVVIFLILKYFGACDAEQSSTIETQVTPPIQASETRPILPEKPIHFTYGTNKEDEDDNDGSSTRSSEDLYDVKLCVICCDEQRNCFFVPCGHCATCFDCAQRIVKEESKMCPICRRLVHKIRRLFTP